MNGEGGEGRGGKSYQWPRFAGRSRITSLSPFACVYLHSLFRWSFICSVSLRVRFYYARNFHWTAVTWNENGRGKLINQKDVEVILKVWWKWIRGFVKYRPPLPPPSDTTWNSHHLTMRRSKCSLSSLEIRVTITSHEFWIEMKFRLLKINRKKGIDIFKLFKF